MSIAENLDKLLHLRGMKPADLARESQVGEPRISQILNGATKSPRTDTLQKLADALKVSISELAEPRKELRDRAPKLENMDISQEERELLAEFRQLRKASRHRIRALIYDELDGMPDSPKTQPPPDAKDSIGKAA